MILKSLFLLSPAYFPCPLCMGSLPAPGFTVWLTRAARAGRSVTQGEPTLTAVPEDPEPRPALGVERTCCSQV